MPTVRELGILADAVYEDHPTKTAGWAMLPSPKHKASSSWNGFQAYTFQKNGQIVIAFRGTAQKIDAVPDFNLTFGINSYYFSRGDDFAWEFRGDPNVFLCGHSLGGAIAQVVANRGGFKFATFNAPGVAVFASRNILSANPKMMKARIVGMVASALWQPEQAMQDIAAAFNIVHGKNICLANDLVSMAGLHYGQVLRIPGQSLNPLIEHKMKTMNQVLLDNDAVARMRVENF